MTDGKLKAAHPLMRSAVTMQRELYGSEPHPDLADAVNDLGSLLEENGDYDEAEKLYREAVALQAAACTETSTRRSPRA